MLNWTEICSLEQLHSILENSITQPIVILKHSTRCSISSMVLNRLNREESIPNVAFYYLDLLQHRDVSNEIASLFAVTHQSPQLLFIKNKTCVFHESQGAIMLDDIAELV